MRALLALAVLTMLAACGIDGAPTHPEAKATSAPSDHLKPTGSGLLP